MRVGLVRRGLRTALLPRYTRGWPPQRLLAFRTTTSGVPGEHGGVEKDDETAGPKTKARGRKTKARGPKTKAEGEPSVALLFSCPTALAAESVLLASKVAKVTDDDGEQHWGSEVFLSQSFAARLLCC